MVLMFLLLTGQQSKYTTLQDHSGVLLMSPAWNQNLRKKKKKKKKKKDRTNLKNKPKKKKLYEQILNTTQLN
jgi:hypothetical protein